MHSLFTFFSSNIKKLRALKKVLYCSEQWRSPLPSLQGEWLGWGLKFIRFQEDTDPTLAFGHPSP